MSMPEASRVRRPRSDGAAGTSGRSGWFFRREVTLGHVLQLAAMIAVLLAGWSDLQKKLAIIQHDVARLITDQQEIRRTLEQFDRRSGEQEYRLRRLEDRFTLEEVER